MVLLQEAYRSRHGGNPAPTLPAHSVTRCPDTVETPPPLCLPTPSPVTVANASMSFSKPLSHSPPLCFYTCVLSVCLPMQVEKPSVQSSKPKKTSTSHKPLRKAKDKQAVSGQAAKKKTAEGPSATKPDDKEQSKEMNNKLAEAKE